MQNKQINKQKNSKYEKYHFLTSILYSSCVSFKGVVIGNVHASCANEIDAISMLQCHIKLLVYNYTPKGYICKNLQIFINYVLVSYTTAAHFQMTKYSEEYMFEIYK